MTEKYKCTYCGAEFKNAQGLTNHIKFKHLGELGASKPSPENPPEEKEAMSLPNQAL